MCWKELGRRLVLSAPSRPQAQGHRLTCLLGPKPPALSQTQPLLTPAPFQQSRPIALKVKTASLTGKGLEPPWPPEGFAVGGLRLFGRLRAGRDVVLQKIFEFQLILSQPPGSSYAQNEATRLMDVTSEIPRDVCVSAYASVHV